MIKGIYSLRYLNTTSKTAAFRKIRDMLFFSAMKAVIVIVLIIFLIAKIAGNSAVKIEDKKSVDIINQALTSIGISNTIKDEVAKAVVTAERHTGIDAFLLVALAVTESSLDPFAKSPKGYYGLMQVPVKTINIKSNILMGAKILQKKIKVANGDIRKAIALYKGYGITRKGLEKAEAVIALYEAIRIIRS